MPITPLHIGLPGLTGYKFHRHVNISSAVIGSVIIDLDFFAFLVFKTPIHGYLHTFLGATIISIALMGIIFSARKSIKKIENWFKFSSSFALIPILIGSILGTFSHVLFDSVIYNDIKPLWPITENPFYLGGISSVFVFIYLITALTTVTLILLIALKSKGSP